MIVVSAVRTRRRRRTNSRLSARIRGGSLHVPGVAGVRRPMARREAARATVDILNENGEMLNNEAVETECHGVLVRSVSLRKRLVRVVRVLAHGEVDARVVKCLLGQEHMARRVLLFARESCGRDKHGAYIATLMNAVAGAQDANLRHKVNETLKADTLRRESTQLEHTPHNRHLQMGIEEGTRAVAVAAAGHVMLLLLLLLGRPMSTGKTGH